MLTLLFAGAALGLNACVNARAVVAVAAVIVVCTTTRVADNRLGAVKLGKYTLVQRSRRIECEE